MAPVFSLEAAYLLLHSQAMVPGKRSAGRAFFTGLIQTGIEIRVGLI